MSFFSRLSFAFRHRTFRVRVAADKALLVHHRGATARIPIRCPHQGASLEHARIEGDCVVCPWHGCRISLVGKAPAPINET